MEETGTTTSLQEPSPPPKEGRALRNVAIVVAVVILLALVGLAVWGMASHPLLTAVIRDISIIVLALVTIIIGLFLVILIFQLQSLIALLRDEVKPILESANQTASTVRGTTTFVSDSVVRPVIEAASFAAGMGRTIRVLTGSDRKKRQRKRSRGSGQG
ncbi:MAG: hypothetical protein M8467_03615 [Anaerolineae bacterium]|nr:hypothetical protein [Anaerolineae bacterium]